jgi:hypothetical protein
MNTVDRLAVVTVERAIVAARHVELLCAHFLDQAANRRAINRNVEFQRLGVLQGQQAAYIAFTHDSSLCRSNIDHSRYRWWKEVKFG